MEITLTIENFEEEVLQHKGKVLVDFWASWCAPCKMMLPVIEEIAREAPEGAKVGKVNVDNYPLLASRYRVQSIPALLIFEDGKVISTKVGVTPKSELLALLG